MIEVNLLELISNYEKKQREAKIEPPYITEIELKNIVIDKVNDELNKLYRDNKIGIKKILNTRIIYEIHSK